MTNLRFLMVAAMFSGVLFAPNVHAGSVTIRDPYLGDMPPGAPNGAAYMIIENSGPKAVQLLSGTSPDCSAVELHEHIHENGRMKMLQVKSVTIPAHGKREFEPMGYHVMLIGMKANRRPGEPVSIQFKFSDGSSISQKFTPQSDTESPH